MCNTNNEVSRGGYKLGGASLCQGLVQVLVHYCLMIKDWKEEVNSLTGKVTAPCLWGLDLEKIRYDLRGVRQASRRTTTRESIHLWIVTCMQLPVDWVGSTVIGSMCADGCMEIGE